MILKASERGGGQNLATHLMNAYSNEVVDIVEVRGAVAQDLSGAFAEWFAQSKLTKGKKYLFSLSVNPDIRQGGLTRDQYLDLAARVETKLKLAGRPRAIVRHIKKDEKGVPREHCHIVWSRTDTDKMKMVPLGKFKLGLATVTREFARDHGIKLPRGYDKGDQKDRTDRKKRVENLKEKQQQERSGFTKTERVRKITDAWNTTKTGAEFLKKLAEMHYFIARGDKRGYVIVDLAGEVHSLTRQIEGHKRGQLEKRLKDFPLDRLPDVRAALAIAKAVRETRAQRREPASSRDDRRDQLRTTQTERRQAVDLAGQKILERQAAELASLRDLQLREKSLLAAAVPSTVPGRVAGFLRRITGIDFILGMRQRAVDKERDRAHLRQEASLELRHHNERFEHSRALRTLDRLDRRERYSLETTLHREEFQRFAAPVREPIRTVEKTVAPAKEPPVARPFPDLLKPERSTPLRDIFNRMAAPSEPEREATRPPATAPENIRDLFTQAAQPKPQEPEPSGLRSLFNRLARRREGEKDIDRDKRYRPVPIDRSIRR